VSTRKGGLGRGLDALIPQSVIPIEITTKTGLQVADRSEVAVENISANPKQPRTVFDTDQLNELAQSIKEVGLLQPPVVRQIDSNKYQLIMGERRFRAAKIAGLKTIPVIIRQTTDDQLLREALIENIHRSQLNPLEEGAAFSQFNYTHDELAARLGKSRPAISNTLRLLNLPPTVQRKVAAGVISAGHARALLGIADLTEIEKLANRIVAEGLTVRQTEEIASGLTSKNGQKPNTAGAKNSQTNKAQLKEIADQLGNRLDTRVSVELGKSKGKITIEFADLEDLNRIKQIINQN
jgi:ParB family chromosome partitioning protein